MSGSKRSNNHILQVKVEGEGRGETRVAVRVFDAKTGNAVNNATVALRDSEGKKFRARTTKIPGRYLIADSTSVGKYIVGASAPGFRGRAVRGNAVEGRVNVANLPLDPKKGMGEKGYLLGFVADERDQRRKLNNAVLELRGRGGNYRVVSDRSGRFKIENVASGDYILRVVRRGFRMYRGGVSIGPGRNVYSVKMVVKRVFEITKITTSSRRTKKSMQFNTSDAITTTLNVRGGVSPYVVNVFRNGQPFRSFTRTGSSPMQNFGKFPAGKFLLEFEIVDSIGDITSRKGVRIDVR